METQKTGVFKFRRGWHRLDFLVLLGKMIPRFLFTQAIPAVIVMDADLEGTLQKLTLVT